MSACLRAAVASATALAGVDVRPVAKVGAFSLTTRSLDSFKVICGRVLAHLKSSVKLLKGDFIMAG